MARLITALFSPIITYLTRYGSTTVSLAARPSGPIPHRWCDLHASLFRDGAVQRSRHTHTHCLPVTHLSHLHHLRQPGCVLLLSSSVSLSFGMPVSQGESTGPEIKAVFVYGVQLTLHPSRGFVKCSRFGPFINQFGKILHDETPWGIQSPKTGSVKLIFFHISHILFPSWEQAANGSLTRFWTIYICFK